MASEQLEPTKPGIDLGIVVGDADAMLKFYRDTVGLPYEGEMPMGGGSVMHRLSCGNSTIKLVAHAAKPSATNPPGGIGGGSGLRYFTISVKDVAACTKSCQEAGSKVAVPPTEIRPGITISIVEDPDGNWLEFLGAS